MPQITRVQVENIFGAIESISDSKEPSKMSRPESSERDSEADASDEEEWLKRVRRHEDALRDIAESESPDSHVAQALLKWSYSDDPTVERLYQLITRKKSDEDFVLARTPGAFSISTQVEKLLSRVSERGA
jgi:hypothetical protein